MQANRPVVGIAYALTYVSVHSALRNALSDIGGVEDLVGGRNVTIKVNATGWGEKLLDKPATETYVVHGDTAYALISILKEAGATTVRILESAPTKDYLASFLTRLGWDVQAMLRLYDVEFINTRNGGDKPYTRLLVHNGRVFDWFDVHHAYGRSDVFISLAKLKTHCTAGITLSLKNMFGMPPNSLYGLDAPSEDGVGARLLIHDRRGTSVPLMPGERAEMAHFGPDVRIPLATVDMCSARPIDLSIIEGVTTIAGGEGPWIKPHSKLRLVSPGVVIVGRDPVATDAVATAVMGIDDPLSATLPPFDTCENHLRIAQEAGLGVGDLSRIDVRGLRIQDVRIPF